ncbi:MAG TPA: hypothetical protein VII22_04775 [Streptosporangiaceae bacterium]
MLDTEAGTRPAEGACTSTIFFPGFSLVRLCSQLPLVEAGRA